MGSTCNNRSTTTEPPPYNGQYIEFGSKFYRQIEGIPMDNTCAPLAADLFLFCQKRDFMVSLSDNSQALWPSCR